MNLSNQSKQLMLFFSKKNHLNYNKITTKTKNIIKELYDEILKSYNYIKKKPHIKLQ